MATFEEVTKDLRYRKSCYSSDNNSVYQLFSAYAHDMYDSYYEKYGKYPSSRWYHRHFSFKRI